jgi:hypothetical protein
MFFRMEIAKDFELNLNFLTVLERVERHSAIEFYQSEYVLCVLQMLEIAQQHLFEEDLVKKYEDKTLEEILSSHLSIIKFSGKRPNPRQDNKLCCTYYDTMMELFITPQHLFYDRFFAYHLKHQDLMEVDQLLEYQLEQHHKNNFRLFARFLHLTIRKYKAKIIPEEVVLTIQEWITGKEQQLKEEQNGLSIKDRYNGKLRIRRTSKDNETILNQPQTVLLIHYMQKKGIFLKNHLLTDADAGKAFELLTAYSQNTIRQDLGKYRDFQNKENLKQLQQVLTGIINLIDNQLNGTIPFS